MSWLILFHSLQVADQAAIECIPLVMEPISRFYTHPVLVLDVSVFVFSMLPICSSWLWSILVWVSFDLCIHRWWWRTTSVTPPVWAKFQMLVSLFHSAELFSSDFSRISQQVKCSPVAIANLVFPLCLLIEAHWLIWKITFGSPRTE